MQDTKVDFNKYIDILKKVSNCNTGNERFPEINKNSVDSLT